MKAIILVTAVILVSIGLAGCGGTKETEKPKATTTAVNTAANTMPTNTTATQGDRDADDIRPANSTSSNSLGANRTTKDADDFRNSKSTANANRLANRKDADDKGRRDDDDDDDR